MAADCRFGGCAAAESSAGKVSRYFSARPCGMSRLDWSRSTTSFGSCTSLHFLLLCSTAIAYRLTHCRQETMHPRDGNDGTMGSEEKHTNAFPHFPPPLEISPQREIPTFPSHRDWSVLYAPSRAANLKPGTKCVNHVPGTKCQLSPRPLSYAVPAGLVVVLPLNGVMEERLSASRATYTFWPIEKILIWTSLTFARSSGTPQPCMRTAIIASSSHAVSIAQNDGGIFGTTGVVPCYKADCLELY